MNDEIQITTILCVKGDGSCSDVILKVPQSEAVKFMAVKHSKGEAEIQYYPEFFSASFSITLLFWLVAKFAWIILETIKRA